YEGLYFGAHGATSFGCSLRFKLVEANFTPSGPSSGSMPSHRMVGRNTGPAQEDDGTGDHGYARPGREEGPDEGFDAPGSDASDPSSALDRKVASKAKPKSKTAPKARTAIAKNAHKDIAAKTNS